jgi:hypothetical protein
MNRKTIRKTVVKRTVKKQQKLYNLFTASIYVLTTIDRTNHGRMNYKDTKPYKSAFL